VRLVVAPTPEEAAALAARHMAGAIRQAIAARGVATIALSGGSSPRPLFAGLARQPLPWQSIHVFQVDERVAPRGDAERNLTSIEAALCGHGPLPRAHLHAMPVDLPDLEEAAAACERELEAFAGRPAALDVVHLGLGTDGHMASLFPGDPALGIQDRNVAVVGPHAGYRRLTLTLPVLNAARNVVWFVTGAAKRAVLTSLAAGGATFPAGRVDAARACAFADEAAAPAG
jgi:6-phosphogluconolactonase